MDTIVTDAIGVLKTGSPAAYHDWRDVEEDIELLLTGENVRPGSGRSGMFPFEILSNHLTATDFLPRIRPPATASAPRIGWEPWEQAVAGGLKPGRALVHAYIERDGVRYTNTVLANRFDLIGVLIRLYQRRSDGRIEAYELNGAWIGVLLPKGRKPAVVLSTRTRRRIRAERNDSSQFDEQELTAAHLAQLRAQAEQDALSNPTRVSDAASELAQIASESLRNGAPLPESQSVPATTPAPASRAMPSTPTVIPPLPGAKVVNFGRRSR